METNPNNFIGGIDFKALNNMIFQNNQNNGQNWSNMGNHNDNQIQSLYQNDYMNMQGSNKEINSSKSPWSTNEEHIF